MLLFIVGNGVMQISELNIFYTSRQPSGLDNVYAVDFIVSLFHYVFLQTHYVEPWKLVCLT